MPSPSPDRTRARGSYDAVLLDIAATGREGEQVGPADGGLTAWTQRLLSNRKERLFTSGLGLGLLAKGFPPVLSAAGRSRR